MCLDINWSYKKPRKPKFVYKFYCTCGYDRTGKNHVISPYQEDEFHLRKGRFIKSNRDNTKITEYEKTCGGISYGFHVFTSRKSAKLCSSATDIIARFTAYPKDFVAGGEFCGARSEVYTKLKFDGWEE